MDRTVVDRLVLARHLYDLANSSLQIANDVGFHSCVNLLQDSVEAFLIAVADHLDATILPKTEFDKYFVQIDCSIAPKELPFKTKLLRLNKIRVMSKHEGILPPLRECESLAHTVRDFFERVSMEHLGVNFFTVTPVDLLSDGEVKTLLAQAKLDRNSGDLYNCIVNCRKALYIEIEQDYDISEFRFGTPKRYGILAGPFSKAPYFARSKAYIDQNVLDSTDFVVIDHDTLDSSLLKNRVDPTMFWNVWRLTPALWRSKTTKEWIVKRDLDLLTDVSLAENVDYVLSTTIDIVLAMHSKKRNIKSQSYTRFEVNLAHEGVSLYRKADIASDVVGITPPDIKKVMADFVIDGLTDGNRYWHITSTTESSLLMGYILQSSLSFDD